MAAAVLCLQTALVFIGMLEAHGLDGRLRLGVRKADDAVEAHAWVGLADASFDPDRLEQGFLPIESQPAREGMR